ncbi:hypothetical protein BH09PLA1_BH09PLA1_23620 [soil metagenome]
MSTIQWRRGAARGAIALAVCFSTPQCSSAQIAHDGSFTHARSLSGPNTLIQPQDGKRVGNNLFYSFSTFNVPRNGAAEFQGLADVRNVLARVTGGSPSSIDGTLSCTIPGASLFFINPAGVTFGNKASIDVQGAFAVSTADSVRLADGKTFSSRVDRMNDALLTSAPPESFGYLKQTDGNNATGLIKFSGCRIKGHTGDTLTISGRNVNVYGAKLNVEVGRINVSATGAGGGRVSLDAGSDNKRLAITERGGPTGAIKIARDAIVTTTRVSGPILITGDSLTLADAQLVVQNSRDRGDDAIRATLDGGATLERARVRVESFGPGDGSSPPAIGDLTINAESIELMDHTFVGEMLGIGLGSVRMLARDKLLVDNFSNIFTANSDSLRGPPAILLAADHVTISNGCKISGSVMTGHVPAVHPIRIEARVSLQVLNGAQVITRDAFEPKSRPIEVIAGSILLDGGEVPAHDGVITGLSANSTEVQAGGGAITVNAQSLAVIRGAAIQARGTRPGSVRINVRDTISFDGGAVMVDTNDSFSDGSSSILIDCGQLTLDHGSILSAESASRVSGGNVQIGLHGKLALLSVRGASSITASSTQDGTAGSVDIRADEFRLDGGSSVSSRSTGFGRAGSVSLLGRRVARVAGSSSITVAAESSGAGDVHLSSGKTVEIFDSALSAVSIGDGGQISLNAPSLIRVVRSKITAQSSANGGVISIDPRNVVLQDSEINGLSANGNERVQITTQALLASNTQILSNQLAAPAPIDLSGALLEVKTSIGSAMARLQESCVAQFKKLSSFAINGRGGVADDPANRSSIDQFGEK